MPFDGSGYEWPPVPPEPERRHSTQENVLTVLAAAFVVLLFVLPISIGTLIDIARSLGIG